MSVLDAAARAVWSVTYPDALDTYDDPELRPERDLARAQARAALAVAPAPSDDDREEAWERHVAQVAPWRADDRDRAAAARGRAYRAGFDAGWAARRSPVSPPEDVAALLDTVHRALWEAHRGKLQDHEWAIVRDNQGETASVTRAEAEAVVAALRAPVPVETVTTVEELDALPPQTVIRGAGLVYEKYANSAGMWSGTRKHTLVESRHLAMILPARILFQPRKEEHS